MNKLTKEREEAIEKLQHYKIQILSREDIDTELYDNCVANSINETPLAYSWVLDFLSPGWKALVINRYEGVMPLPIQKKLGFDFVQMPFEVLNLGIFSQHLSIIQLFPEVFHHSVFKRFRFIQYNGSPSRTIKKTNVYSQIKQTYELNLNSSYERIYRSYSRSHRRSIREFEESNLELTTKDFSNNFTQMIGKVSENRPELYMPPSYRLKFEAMAAMALEKQRGSTYSVLENGQIIGAGFFLIGKKRIIPYHLADDSGRRSKTSFGIIDQFIKDHAGSDQVIDFAGSTIPNVATFNKRFGATTVPYCAVKINHLPPPFKWIKEKNLLFRAKQSFLR